MRKSIFSLLMLLALTVNAQRWNGYTLYSTQNSTSAYLVDTNWVTYHSWTGLGSATGYSTHLMPGGTLVRAAKGGTNPSGVPGGPICGRITKHDYSGTIVWDYIYNTTNYVTHHDIHPMPNGNVLVIAYERRTAAELSAAGCNTFSGEMWPDKIVEIQPTGATTGTVVWEWKSWDHLMQNVDSTKANYVTSLVNNPQLLNINYLAQKDWQHMNGIDYNPILDQIAWSSHNHHEWYIIDHSTTTAEAAGHTGGNSGKGGDILYRWGNPAAYGASGTQVLNVTHDAHWIPEGVPNAGRIAGYNNKGVSASQSAADQVVTPINGYNYTITAGQAYTPNTYTSRNTATGLYSSNMGSTQQLPNGNEFVCEATAGTVWEFSPSGAVLNSHTFSGSIAQSKKYSACYVNNPAPAIPTITANNTTLQASSATTYQWYLNGVLITGATNQTYTATQSGIYVVRITDANGCVYQYSKGYNLTLNPTNTTTVDFEDKVNFYPNPTSGIVNIKNPDHFGKEFHVQVMDQSGRIILTINNASQLDLSNKPNGIYYIKLTGEFGSVSKKIILNK